MRLYPRQYSSFVFFASFALKNLVCPSDPAALLFFSAVNINFDFVLPMPDFLRASVVDVVQFFASSFPRAHLKTVELSGEANDSFNQ